LTQICRNCGSRTSRDSVFCEQCGSKLFGVHSKNTSVKSYEPNKESYRKRDSPPQFYSSPYRRSSVRKPVFFGFIAVFFIIALSGALFLALVANDRSYEFVGGTYAIFEQNDYQDMAEVEFIVDNSIGNIDITFRNNDSDFLVMIDLNVYGPSGSSLGDSNMFESQELGNRTLFIFNSWNPYTNDEFKYDMHIEVSTLLRASFDIQVITGEIIFQAGGTSTIEGISLETTTGSIYASFVDTRFPNENYVSHLNTVTGSVDAYFTNILSEGDLYWSIQTVSGSIYTRLEQYDLPVKNATYHLDLKAVTGEINYQFEINELANFGYFIDSTVVTGQTIIYGFSPSIDLPYYSPNFGMASLNIVSTFETTTGSITILKS
jgi:ribosomal protein L40E